MSPRIFEINKDSLKITENTLLIKECRDIVEKYKNKANGYLMYCHLLSAIDSPFRNLPEEEKKEAVITEVASLYGEIDFEDPLLEICVEKLKSLYQTPILKLFEGLTEEVNNILYFLKTTPTSEDNISYRTSILEKAGKLSSSLAQAQKQVLEELKQNTRGDQEVGVIY
jgi:hypothetical protein